MKKLILFTFAFCLSTFAFAQQYGWKDLSTNISIQADLTDVFFISENEGWISTAFADASILYTADGGETFEMQHAPQVENIWTIHMLDAMNGYCGGDGGRIYKTSDGGENWNAIGSMGAVSDISFPSNTSPSNPIGYASGDNGNVWEITSTLTKLNSPSSSAFRGVSAPSVNNVWVCGGNRIYYYNGIYFTSQNAPTGTFNDIHFINNQEGWVVGDGGVIGITTDGGANWIKQTNPDTQNRSLYGVFFLDSDNGWAVGVGGVILKTTDGGNNWAVVGAGITTEGLSSIHFTSPTNGYIVGNNKTLLKYGEISGIGDNKKIIDFEIFPNPTKNKIQIKCSEFKTESGTVEILSTNGKEILKKGIATGQEKVEIDVSHLQSGVYFCTLKTNKGNATKKLIIHK